jgi:hypothetical protein
MACTSCNNQCFCSVVQGANVTVTGSGSGADPYVVSAIVPVVPAETPFVGTSSDLTLLTITPGGPFGHSPTFNPIETVFAAIPGPGITVTPGGVAGHTPTIQARISTDPLNAVTFGTDTGLFVSAGVAPAGFTLNGAVAGCGVNSYVGGLIPNGGIMTVFANDGIQISGTAPNIAIRTRNTGVFGVGPLAFPCGDTNGAPIYCGSDGLRTVPEHTSAIGPRTCSTTAGDASPGVVGLVVTTINNPSPCRSMSVHASYGYGAQIGVGPGLSGVLMQWGLTLLVGIWTGYLGVFTYNAINHNNVAAVTGAGLNYDIQSSNFDDTTIPPGGVVTMQLASAITATAGSNPNSVAEGCISFFGVTR